jgi:hypothetical protein
MTVIFLFICLIWSCLTVHSKDKNLIKIIKPGKPIQNIEFKNNKEEIYLIRREDLKPNRHHKIMVYYLGSVNIFKKIS